MTAADPRAKPYHRAKLGIFAADLFLSGAFLVAFQVSGLSAALAAWAWAPERAWPLIALIYLSVFFNLYYLLSLPLGFYSSYVLEKKYHLSTQSFGGWAADRLKAYTLSFLFFVSLVVGLLFLVRRFPGAWWLVAGVGWLAVTLLLSRILPTVLIPLFYKMRALPEGELRDRLSALLKKHGVRVLDLYEIALSKKTRKANAALVGIGKSRRVILGDTLLERYALPEIEMVMAHELGHHVLRHIPKVVAFNTATTLAGFYMLERFSALITARLGADGLTDLSIFPALLLLASLGGLLLLPVQNGFSRRQENEADRFALETFPSKETFASLMQKLGTQNLSDPEPNPVIEFIFYDHPSISHRLEKARALD